MLAQSHFFKLWGILDTNFVSLPKVRQIENEVLCMFFIGCLCLVLNALVCNLEHFIMFLCEFGLKLYIWLISQFFQYQPDVCAYRPDTLYGQLVHGITLHFLTSKHIVLNFHYNPKLEWGSLNAVFSTLIKTEIFHISMEDWYFYELQSQYAFRLILILKKILNTNPVNPLKVEKIAFGDPHSNFDCTNRNEEQCVYMLKKLHNYFFPTRMTD